MKLITLSLVFAVGFSAGALFGFIKAPAEMDKFESQYIASLVVYENEWLKNGSVELVTDKNELIINHELAKFGEHLDSNLFWIFKLIGIQSDNDESIKHAVNYRINNPYKEPDMASYLSWREGTDMNIPMVQEVIESQKNNQQLMQKVIDRYRSANK